MIITIGNIKGGVGKSCIAQNLAVYISFILDKSVVLVDADPKETSADWINERRKNKELKNIKRFKLTGEIKDELLDLEEQYECVVVDCGGHQDNTFINSILASTHVIMPFRPKRRDLKSLDKVKKLISNVRALNPICNFRALITQAPTHKGGKTRVEQAKQHCLENDLDSIYNYISNREIYDDAEENGASIFEIIGHDKKAQEMAIKEFKAVAKEIMEI